MGLLRIRFNWVPPPIPRKPDEPPPRINGSVVDMSDGDGSPRFSIRPSRRL